MRRPIDKRVRDAVKCPANSTRHATITGTGSDARFDLWMDSMPHCCTSNCCVSNYRMSNCCMSSCGRMRGTTSW